MTEKEKRKKKWDDSKKRIKELYNEFNSYNWTEGCDEKFYKKKQSEIGKEITSEIDRSDRLFDELTQLCDIS